MSDYETAIAALQAIANFGHAEECGGCAPVHECGCYEKSEKEIARECLRALGEEVEA